MIEVDVRGFSCPIPVVRTKKAMAENPGKALIVLVEEGVTKENVIRLAQSEKYAVSEDKGEDGYRLLLTPSEA